jgi:small neutral amino acid transporter SnatA (MarC family)
MRGERTQQPRYAAAAAVSTLILLPSSAIERIAGKKVIAAFEKLAGLVLTAIAVDMFLKGLFDYIKHIETAAR